MQTSDPPPLSHDRTPAQIGRYEVVCKLGVGGMADVYLAHQPGPFSAGKLVVIKQLRPGVVGDEQFVQMFADESRIAVRLNHPNVVHTYEVVAEDDEYYLTLEFVDGKPLHQVLREATRKEMSVPLHVWILTQVLAGLHYAHELAEFDGTPMGIVHRDVSPSNVMLTYEGEVKLLDFGIAKSIGAIAATREGIIKGKLGYAAPEQCLCKATDRRTDIFAVGIMLWEAVTQTRHSGGETEAGTYQARIQGTEQRLEDACPTAPRGLVDICNKALAQHPDDRFATALEFRQALMKYLRSIAWEGGPEKLSEFMRRHFRDEMIAMRERIDEHLGSAHDSPNVGNLPIQSEAPSVRRASQDRSKVTRAASLESLTEATVPPAAQPWFKQPAVLTMGAVLVLGSAGFLFFGQKTSTNQTPTAAGVVARPTSEVSAPVGAQAHAAQASGQLMVTLAATPADAVIRLDGRRISNPYRAAHGLDNALHHLTVTLAGYQSVERELVFDRDIDATVELVAEPSQRGAGRARAVSRSAATPHAGTTAATPRGEAEPKPQTVQPGESLNANTSRAKPRDIDETDPYKR